MRALLVVVIAGCAGGGGDDVLTDEHGEPLPSAGTAMLRAETVVIPAHLAKDAIVEWDHVILPAGITLRPRDVIVSGHGDGFLRRAITITDHGDTLRVVTSPATLAEAVITASLDVHLDDTVTVEHRFGGASDALTANVDGTLALAPATDLDFTIVDGALASFGLAMTGTGEAALAGTLDFASTTHRSWGEEHQLDETLFRRTYALGPLPIVIVGRVRGTLAGTGFVDAPVTFGSGARGPLVFDARSTYTPEAGWSATQSGSFAATQVGPTHAGAGTASLAIGVTARFELAFYGTTGPSIVTSAQSTGHGTYCNAARFTALQAGLFGDGVFELAALAPMQRIVIPLWASRVALDPLETCTL